MLCNRSLRISKVNSSDYHKSLPCRITFQKKLLAHLATKSNIKWDLIWKTKKLKWKCFNHQSWINEIQGMLIFMYKTGVLICDWAPRWGHNIGSFFKIVANCFTVVQYSISICQQLGRSFRLSNAIYFLIQDILNVDITF